MGLLGDIFSGGGLGGLFGGGGGGGGGVGSGFASGFNSLSSTANTSANTTATGGGVAISSPTGPITFGVDQNGLERLVGRLSQASSEQVSQFLNLLATQQGQLGTLAENRQTGDDKTKNQTMAWLAGLVVLAVVWLAIKVKR